MYAVRWGVSAVLVPRIYVATFGKCLKAYYFFAKILFWGLLWYSPSGLIYSSLFSIGWSGTFTISCLLFTRLFFASSPLSRASRLIPSKCVEV